MLFFMGNKTQERTRGGRRETEKKNREELLKRKGGLLKENQKEEGITYKAGDSLIYPRH